MTRDEQLKFCQICKNQVLDPKIGTICSITDRVADFDGYCKNYNQDTTLEQVGAPANNTAPALAPASTGKRFANYILDAVFCWIFTLIFAFFLGIVLSVVSPSSLSAFNNGNLMISYLLAALSLIIYYSLFEFTTGRTPAKYITKTMVVDRNGNIPNLGTILVRTICRLIPFEAFSFLGSSAIGWHDTISKTRVINMQ